jgi:hypothetical protein
VAKVVEGGARGGLEFLGRLSKDSYNFSEIHDGPDGRDSGDSRAFSFLGNRRRRAPLGPRAERVRFVQGLSAIFRDRLAHGAGRRSSLLRSNRMRFLRIDAQASNAAVPLGPSSFSDEGWKLGRVGRHAGRRHLRFRPLSPGERRDARRQRLARVGGLQTCAEARTGERSADVRLHVHPATCDI